jgi:hypothetical protein
MPKGAGAGMSFILMLTLFSGQAGPIAHVSRILGAAAQVSEAAGDAASSVVHKGTALTAAMSSAVIDITSTSFGALQTAWHGVDLVNLTVEKISGTVTASSPRQIVACLNSYSGRLLTTVEDEQTMQVRVLMLQDVCRDMPHLSRSQERLELTGSFRLITGEVQQAASGQTAFLYEIARASFAPQWANPLWAVLELSHEAEHPQALDTLRAALHAAPLHNQTLTQRGPEALSRTAWLWLCLHALRALREGDWSALSTHGNLWGSGILLLWWFCTKLAGREPEAAPAAEQPMPQQPQQHQQRQQGQQDAFAVAAEWRPEEVASGSLSHSQSEISAATSSANSSFEVVGSIQ